MKITIPKVIIVVQLSEYHPDLDGKALHIWVNPPIEKLREYDQLVTRLQARELESTRARLMPAPGAPEVESKKGPLERAMDQLGHWLKHKQTQDMTEIDLEYLSWFVELWSQGPEAERWTLEEIRELEAQDPTFLEWMIAQTWKARREHIEKKKKA